MPRSQNRFYFNWLNHFHYFNIPLQPPVRYWQESPKDATNENIAANDDTKNDPKQTLSKKQKMENKKKTQKTKKRKQDDEQPDAKTFLSGVRMTIQNDH